MQDNDPKPEGPERVFFWLAMVFLAVVSLFAFIWTAMVEHSSGPDPFGADPEKSAARGSK